MVVIGPPGTSWTFQLASTNVWFGMREDTDGAGEARICVFEVKFVSNQRDG